MKLSGPLRKKLQTALIDAFPDRSSLEQMLSFELDKNLETIAEGNNLEKIVFELIKKAESQGWIKNLVNAACHFNSGNQNLLAIQQDLNALIFKEPEADSDYTKESEQPGTLSSILKLKPKANHKFMLHLH